MYIYSRPIIKQRAFISFFGHTDFTTSDTSYHFWNGKIGTAIEGNIGIGKIGNSKTKIRKHYERVSVVSGTVSAQCSLIVRGLTCQKFRIARHVQRHLWYKLSNDTVPNHILLFQPITKLYLFTNELKLRDDFRYFRSKMCFRTFSTVRVSWTALWGGVYQWGKLG